MMHVIVRLTWILCAAWIALVSGGISTAFAARIAVVKSAELDSYNSVITSFTVNSNDTVVEYNLSRNVNKGKRVMELLAATPPELVLAVGPLAASLAKQALKDVPIVFCLVPDSSLKSLKADNITGISMQLPIKTQLKVLKLMAQNVQSVGVIYNKQHTGRIIEESRQVAAAIGLQLVAEEIDSRNQVAEALARMRGKVDALWVVPDNLILNQSAHASLVDFAVRMKIPLFSLTSKFVKVGALVSLSPDYTLIGKQAATIAKRILKDRVSPTLIPVTPPEGMEIALNLDTAKKIGVECDIALKVFTFAAKRGFPIKVF